MGYITEPPEHRQALTIEEVGRLLSVSRSTVARLIAAGELRSFHIGRSRRVLAESVEQFVAKLEQAERDAA